jgi:ATP-dependent Zn protease
MQFNKKVVKYLDMLEYCAFLLFIYFMFKRLRASGGGGDMFQMGKTNVKMFGVENKINTRFADVAGQESAKMEITEFVEFLKNPEKYLIYNKIQSDRSKVT